MGRLVVEVKKSDLLKAYLISRPAKHNPGIIIFSVVLDVEGSSLVEIPRIQNSTLDKADMIFRTMLQGKRWGNAIVSLDPTSYKRLAGMKRLNAG